MIDAVLEPGIAGGVGAGLALEHERAAIGEDEPRPDQQHAALAEGDARVVFADEARALRDQEQAAGRAVIDILGDLRGDLAGQVRADAGDQRGGDDRSCLQEPGRGRGLDAVGGDGPAVGGGVQEGAARVGRWGGQLGPSGRAASSPGPGGGAGLEEEPAHPGGLFLGEAGLFRRGPWRAGSAAGARPAGRGAAHRAWGRPDRRAAAGRDAGWRHSCRADPRSPSAGGGGRSRSARSARVTGPGACRA
jgi:hypothetical protein